MRNIMVLRCLITMNLVVEIRKINPSPQKLQDKTKHMHTHTQTHAFQKTIKKIIEHGTILSIVFFSCRDFVNYVVCSKNLIIRVSKEYRTLKYIRKTK